MGNKTTTFEFSVEDNQTFVDSLLCIGESFLIEDKGHYKKTVKVNSRTVGTVSNNFNGAITTRTYRIEPQVLKPEIKLRDKTYINDDYNSVSDMLKRALPISGVGDENTFYNITRTIDSIDELFIHDAQEFNNLIGNVIELDETLIK